MGTVLKRTLKEVANYPPHPPRHPTPEFIKNHEAMIHNDTPCHGCGVRHSQLNKGKVSDSNPWGATQMESHHWIIEDSMADAIDLDYFNKVIAPGVAINMNDSVTYAKPFTQEQMIAWIHGHAHNLIPLCDMCHRHPFIGIHAITYPIWRIRRAVTKGFDLTSFHPHSPAEAVALANLPTTVGTPDPVVAPVETLTDPATVPDPPASTSGTPT